MVHPKAAKEARVASKTVTSKGLLMVNTGPGKGDRVNSRTLTLSEAGGELSKGEGSGERPAAHPSTSSG